jgi:hypothetical protein
MRAGLVKDDIPEPVAVAICRRIIVGQSLYAAGAVLSVFDTRWSIAFIVLVLLN